METYQLIYLVALNCAVPRSTKRTNPSQRPWPSLPRRAHTSGLSWAQKPWRRWWRKGRRPQTPFAVLSNQSLGPLVRISAAADLSHTTRTWQSTSQSLSMQCLVFHPSRAPPTSTRTLCARPGGRLRLLAAGTVATPLKEAVTWWEIVPWLAPMPELHPKPQIPPSRGEVTRLKHL